MNSWLIFQKGSREKYFLAASLYKRRQLKNLITDIWKEDIPFYYLLSKVIKSLNSRSNVDIPKAKVISSLSLLFLELGNRIYTYNNSDQKVADFFADKISILTKSTKERYNIFSYNYTAYQLFRVAKKKNCKLILGQIDAGPVAGELVTQLHKKYLGGNYNHLDLYQTDYLEKWNEEIGLADHIIVNSKWSKKCIVEAGADEKKVSIIPIGYVPPPDTAFFKRKFQYSFSKNRPLRILYLGRLSVIKGLFELIELANLCLDLPVIFNLVGRWGIPENKIPEIPPNVKINKHVSQAETSAFYQHTDLFIHPTHSDGFAITQLEAQSWKVPILTTPFCAEIVKDNINGRIVPEVNPRLFKEVINEIIQDPELLQSYSANSIALEKYSPENIIEEYLKL